GCLLTGCCFGEATTSAWGLTYAAGSPAWWAQVQAGLLPAGAPHSLPVVPTQLLALLLCATVGGVLLATRNRRWPVGSWLLLQTGLLLLGRFGQGFWRDPASEPVAGTLHPLLGGQWLELQLWLLPLALLALGAWAWRVRRPVTSSLLQQPVATALPVPASRYLLVLVGLLAVTAALSATALTPPETMVVRGVLLLVLVMEASQLLVMGSMLQGRQSTTWSLHLLRSLPLPRLLPVGLAAVVFVLTSQTPADSTQHRALLISLGAAQGQYDEDLTQEMSGCGSSLGGSTRTVNRTAFYHNYRVAGGSVAYALHNEQTNSIQKVGAGVTVGSEQIGFQRLVPNQPFIPNPPRTTHSFALFDINPFMEGRFRLGQLSVGYRGGMHIGLLGHVSHTAADSSVEYSYLAPDARLWVGNRRVLFGQVDTGTGFMALGNYTSRFGLGTGLGADDGRYVLAGMAVATHEPGYNMGFISANLQLANTGVSLEPYVASDFDRHYQMNLRLHYQIPLGHK
ncbi:MAG: hypothetical protein M3Y54_16110, partial [Bacteroidota bacterium]|nr:hypothetical protein [Bacteroidota bacterium]